MYLMLLLLVTAVIFVNGWTDAPNAITCVVSTGTLRYRSAVRMAALCNLLGIGTMGVLNTAVADTVSSLVRLDPARPRQSVAVLCAAMVSIVLFSVVAWAFGIPTSESHALIAALTGAALAGGSPGAVNLSAWIRVLAGLGISLGAGLGAGWGVGRTLGPVLLRRGGRVPDLVQIWSGAGMAFLHGAQDGQKFLAVLVLAGHMAQGVLPRGINMGEHLPAMLLCAVVMGLGTLAGGRRIITRVGGDMVQLRKHQGASADIGGALCLLGATLAGIPVSTTHTKTTAILGAGLATGQGEVDRSVVRQMVLVWLFTFPVCGMMGYLCTSYLLYLL